MVNLESYKKACVNKAKPMLHCNGKCQMLKKMKKQDGDNGAGTTAPKFNQPDVVLSSKNYFPSLHAVTINDISYSINYNSSVTSSYLASIFHPPCICNTI